MCALRAAAVVVAQLNAPLPGVPALLAAAYTSSGCAQPHQQQYQPCRRQRPGPEQPDSSPAACVTGPQSLQQQQQHRWRQQQQQQGMLSRRLEPEESGLGAHARSSLPACRDQPARQRCDSLSCVQQASVGDQSAAVRAVRAQRQSRRRAAPLRQAVVHHKAVQSQQLAQRIPPS